MGCLFMSIFRLRVGGMNTPEEEVASGRFRSLRVPSALRVFVAGGPSAILEGSDVRLVRLLRLAHRGT